MFHLLPTVSFFFTFTFARAVSTNLTCVNGDNCPAAAQPQIGSSRNIANYVSNQFRGFVEIASNPAGTSFSADMQLLAGEAWPRISEGAAIPLANTPGFPISLTDYFTNDKLHVKYKGRWSARTRGPPRRRRRPNTPGPPPPARPSGRLYLGVQMFLNDPKNYDLTSGTPIWPFTAKISVFHRYDGLKHAYKQACNYTDTDGMYTVVSGMDGKILTYIILNQSSSNLTDMDLDTVKLFRTLVTSCNLPKNLQLLEVSIIVQAYAPVDARFYADVESMGRAPESSRKTTLAAQTNPSVEDKPRANNSSIGNGNGNANNNNQSTGDGGAKWEIVGSVIGAIATLIAAILTVYLSQGKCRRRRKENHMNNGQSHLDGSIEQSELAPVHINIDRDRDFGRGMGMGNRHMGHIEHHNSNMSPFEYADQQRRNEYMNHPQRPDYVYSPQIPDFVYNQRRYDQVINQQRFEPI